ncbi:MAG: IS481 family transposase [Actinomycetota bacterium]
MSNVRTQHPNAVLTPQGRRRMVGCVIDRGWTIEATAERFQIDAKTVRKWRDRFLTEGPAGLFDRSSRPRTSPNRTPVECRRRIIELRKQRRWGAAHIGHEVGRAGSTVQKVLHTEGLGRLDSGDRATAEPVRRYQRERPGELVHVDVKKISGIPAGGGWRIHGRGHAPPVTRSSTGYRFIHSALDDRTRIVYSEIHTNEQAITAIGFWERANTWFNRLGIVVERVITDNGSCYRSRLWRDCLVGLGITPKRTRPYRPQTNGKIERFHRILLEEWAYIRDWHTDTERTTAYDNFVHFYNHHRAHGALGWSTPMTTLEDNLPGQHN